MIRRQFIKMIAQLSVIGFVLKGHSQEQVSSDLAPRVDPEVVIQFERRMSLSSAPLSMGPLCAPSISELPR